MYIIRKLSKDSHVVTLGTDNKWYVATNDAKLVTKHDAKKYRHSGMWTEYKRKKN